MIFKGYENKILRQGTTLITRQTAMWSKERIKENEYIENCMVFANFSNIDDGRSRELVATFDNPSDALNAVAVHNSKVKDEWMKHETTRT